MLDQKQMLIVGTRDEKIETYDLVVIGAGIAGLNALYAATDYLPNSARVLLLDQKATAGGMWNTAYDYVRLHQPHPMFTVGDIKWDWRKPRHYLAARDEVRDHLAKSLDTVAKAVALNTFFGQTVSTCEEIQTPDGFHARITYHPNEDPQSVKTVLASQAIYASGLNYRVATPLALSSGVMVSVIPQEILNILSQHPEKPVYVVGGGKTGIDTVLTILAKDPTRKVTLINGRGTNFMNRTKYLPTGIKRWTSGELVSRLFRDVAYKFDGDNEDETIQHLRKTHSTDPETDNGVFLYGLQSEEECTRLEEGLDQKISDYLVDVVDSEEGPVLQLRGGAKHPVDPGSIFVNCCGSFFRAETLDAPMPFLSPQGTVLSLNARDGIHFLTSVAGFFSVHLHYRDQLKGRGFCSLDHEALFRQNRNAWVGASAAQAYMNQTIAVQTLPLMLLDRCGLDLDRWYPFPRRMMGLYKMKTSAKADISHCRQVLDRVSARFDISCVEI